jgi:hypothetical protein
MHRYLPGENRLLGVAGRDVDLGLGNVSKCAVYREMGLTLKKRVCMPHLQKEVSRRYRIFVIMTMPRQLEHTGKAASRQPEIKAVKQTRLAHLVADVHVRVDHTFGVVAVPNGCE